MKNILLRAIATAALTAAASASAGVLASFDATARPATDRYASFQANTLLANDYIEDGLIFRFTGIGNNAGCGYAGFDCYDYPQD